MMTRTAQRRRRKAARRVPSRPSLEAAGATSSSGTISTTKSGFLFQRNVFNVRNKFGSKVEFSKKIEFSKKVLDF